MLLQPRAQRRARKRERWTDSAREQKYVAVLELNAADQVLTLTIPTLKEAVVFSAHDVRAVEPGNDDGERGSRSASRDDPWHDINLDGFGNGDELAPRRGVDRPIHGCSERHGQLERESRSCYGVPFRQTMPAWRDGRRAPPPTCLRLASRC